MEDITIYNEDCFEGFKKVKDKSVNLFLLDLPYGQTSCKWDSVIDLEKMWKEIKRTLVKDGIVVFFCTTKFGFTLIQSNPKWFKYDLVWKKSRKVGFLSANKMPLRQHEMIYVFKDKQGKYNPQKVEGKPYKKTQSKLSDLYGMEDKEAVKTINKGDRYPTSIVKDLGLIEGGYYRGEGKKPFKRMANDPNSSHPTSIIENTILEYKNPYNTLHKTQKPVDLCEWLIKSYSNEADVVMDFCMGSGTTGIACKNTKRKFIGVEMDKDIFEIAKERIEMKHL